MDSTESDAWEGTIRQISRKDRQLSCARAIEIGFDSCFELAMQKAASGDHTTELHSYRPQHIEITGMGQENQILKLHREIAVLQEQVSRLSKALSKTHDQLKNEQEKSADLRQHLRLVKLETEKKVEQALLDLEHEKEVHVRKTQDLAALAQVIASCWSQFGRASADNGVHAVRGQIPRGCRR